MGAPLHIADMLVTGAEYAVFFDTIFQSEKLLGDLGGLFSKKWKPKKNGAIRGPMLTRGNYLKLDCMMTKETCTASYWTIGYGAVRDWKDAMMYADDSFIRKGSHLEQRQKLGLADHPPRSNARQFRSEPSSALEKVEVLLTLVKLMHLPHVMKFWCFWCPTCALHNNHPVVSFVDGEGKAGWCSVWSKRHTDRAERDGRWHGLWDREVIHLFFFLLYSQFVSMGLHDFSCITSICFFHFVFDSFYYILY